MNQMTGKWVKWVLPAILLVLAVVVWATILLPGSGAFWLQMAGRSEEPPNGSSSPSASGTVLPTAEALLQLVPTSTPVPLLSATLPPTPSPLEGVPGRAALATAAAQLEASPSPAASPQPAISPSPSLAPLQTVLQETFTDNQKKWPDNQQATAWFAGGAYHLFARQPGRFVAIGAPLAQPLSDVIITASFHKVGGPPGGGYGVIVRDQGPGPRDGINQRGRYYVLAVGDRGEVGIWRREDDRWIDLLPWTPSAAVSPGTAPNQLTVQAIGSRLTLLVNGRQAASLEDATLPAGGVGVFVGGDLNEVTLERFVVQVPS